MTETAAPLTMTRRRFRLPEEIGVIIALLAVLYIVSPLDLIPDWIPVIGWLDDLGVLAWAARQVFFKRDV